MPTELLLMRHAKSDWQSNAATDFERPLNKRGQADAPKMGCWLQQQQLIPDSIISSPAKRAKQTISKVCANLAIDQTAIVWQPLVYAAGLTDLLAVLTAISSDKQRVLLVGHNPGLEQLAVYLTQQADIVMKTATIVHLSILTNWSELTDNCASVIQIQSPKDLA